MSLSARRQDVSKALRSRGFDAVLAHAMNAITVVPAPRERPELAPIAARYLLSQTAFLPCYPQLPDRAVRELIEAIRAAQPGQTR